MAEDAIVLLSSLYYIIVNKNKGNIYIEYENVLLPIGSMLICITICFFDIKMINNFYAIGFVIIYIIILLVVIVELYGNNFIDKLGVNNIVIIVEIDLLLYFMFLSGVIKSVNSVALFLFSLLFALIMYINTTHNRTNNFLYIILKIAFAFLVLYCFSRVIYIFSLYLVKIKDDVLIFL